MIVIVTAVSVFGVDHGWFEQSDLIIPHQGLFVDAVHGGELADREKFVFLVHKHLIKSFKIVLTEQLQYGL